MFWQHSQPLHIKAFYLPYFLISLFLSLLLLHLHPSVSACLLFSGVVSLSQALCSNNEYSNSLLHLDLSKNPGVLTGDDASVRQHNPSKPEHAVLLFSSLNCHPPSVFLFAEPLSLLVSAKLPGPLGSIMHRLYCWLCEYKCQDLIRHFMWKVDALLSVPRLTISTMCLMQLFGALLRGCCADLSFLNLSKNTFSHRLVISHYLNSLTPLVGR